MFLPFKFVILFTAAGVFLSFFSDVRFVNNYQIRGLSKLREFTDQHSPMYWLLFKNRYGDHF